MTYPIMEQAQLLQNINIVSFVLVDMVEYLDTHPNDRNAIDYFNHYSRIKNELSQEYSMKYGPLTLSTVETNSDEWKWALQEPPWKGGMC